MIKLSVIVMILFLIFLGVRMIQAFFHHRRFMREYESHANDPLPSIDSNNVPQNLRHLVPLAEKWGISDDVERAHTQDKISLQEKQAFFDAVWPHMEEIDTWVCQEHEKPPISYEATVFMFLTEAAAEIKGDFEGNSSR